MSRDRSPTSGAWRRGRKIIGDADPYLILEDPKGRDVTLLIQRVEDRIKPGKNPVHIDLFTSDPEGEADRLVARGATRLETHDGSHKAIVLDEPQGNVFCVIDSGSTEA